VRASDHGEASGCHGDDEGPEVISPPMSPGLTLFDEMSHDDVVLKRQAKWV